MEAGGGGTFVNVDLTMGPYKHTHTQVKKNLMLQFNFMFPFNIVQSILVLSLANNPLNYFGDVLQSPVIMIERETRSS